MSRLRWLCIAAVVACCAMPAVGATDVIIQWDDAYLDAIRATGGPPCPIARKGAMLHVAMYDAVMCVDKTYQTYMAPVAAPTWTSKDAAAATAAYTVMVNAYPTLKSSFDALYASQLAAIANGPGKTAGIQLGQTVGQNMNTLRYNDGSQIPDTYTPQGTPGTWRPTADDYTAALNPSWHYVKPWAMVSGSQFRPPPPPALTSAEYTANWLDVYQKGALVNSTRTPEETQIAAFWANDRDGTYKPPGQWFDIAQTASAAKGLTMEQNARLFALISIAQAEAGLTAWEAKYVYDLWRPVTGIQLADQDGNPMTTADPNWKPLSADPFYNGFTPAFPTYTSGHATFGGASATILEDYFGPMTLAIGTDDPGYTGPPLRVYDSFLDMATENSRSRVLLGVHWQFDNDWGQATGEALGQYVFDTQMRPIPEPLTLIGIAMGCAAAGGAAIRRRRAARQA